MRKHSALGIAVLVGILVLAMAVPAHARTRIRFYRGETSQGENISFIVAKTDAGRFLRDVVAGVSLTCEDLTTEEFTFGISFQQREVPITDRAFSVEDRTFSFRAVHLAGEIGRLEGQGTLSVVEADLTDDDQAQLCTTGDLTWTVEFVRRL